MKFRMISCIAAAVAFGLALAHAGDVLKGPGVGSAPVDFTGDLATLFRYPRRHPGPDGRRRRPAS